MKKNILIIILLLVILGLGGWIVYDKMNVKTSNQDEKEEVKEEVKTEESTKKEYKYDEIAGYYHATKEIELYDTKTTTDILLVLNADGTFTYDTRRDTHAGAVGNYIIDNNTIVLNCVFFTYNDTSLNYNSMKSVKLNINEDDTLYMEGTELLENSKNITFKKITDNSTIEQIKEKTQNSSVDYRLKNSQIVSN